MGNPNYAERNRKISEKAKLRWQDPVWVAQEMERRAKMPHYKSKRYRSKVARSNRKKWEDEEWAGARRAQLASEEFSKTLSEAQLSNSTPEERSARQKASHSGEKFSKKQSRKIKGAWRDPEKRARMEKANKRAGRKRSASLKRYWANPENREKRMAVLRQMYSEFARKPSNPELWMKSLLRRLGYSYRYTAKKRNVIGSYSPDFLHKTRKLVIEVYGFYFHNKPAARKHDRERIKLMKLLGYKVLVVWDYEFRDLEKLSQKIRRFHSRKHSK